MVLAQSLLCLERCVFGWQEAIYLDPGVPGLYIEHAIQDEEASRCQVILL